MIVWWFKTGVGIRVVTRGTKNHWVNLSPKNISVSIGWLQLQRTLFIYNNNNHTRHILKGYNYIKACLIGTSVQSKRKMFRIKGF